MVLDKSRKARAAVGNLAKTAIVKTVGHVKPVGKSPDETYGDLFADVQAKRVYSDGKTFPDMVPKGRIIDVVRAYHSAAKQPGFNLQEFVAHNFADYSPAAKRAPYVPAAGVTAREHVRRLWDELERRNRRDRGSLLSLPYPYIVPGGRFSEQFYWDSYFVMLGLAADHKWQLIQGMIKNYAFMIRKFGNIPTANRTYFLSRSQPPFFVYMVKLLASHSGQLKTYAEYLPYLLSEYRFWMKGRRHISGHVESAAYYRVVQMPNGVVLNRYFDNKQTPRPESRREDMETAAATPEEVREKLFVDLRAGAESGWDFSTRWFKGRKGIETIHTTDMVAVDLNCLLYTLERTLATTYSMLKQPLLARTFTKSAERRAESIRQYCWNSNTLFFADYDFRKGKVSDALTLAGVFPLFAKIATRDQAEAVAARLEHSFLKDGGLTTTLEHSGQQWDAPNGWAPLQWVAIQGLREYGFYALAKKIRDRWLKTNELVFERHRKMIEKYDVERPGNLGGGGEYALQDGFGWTNGVYAALKDEQSKERDEK